MRERFLLQRQLTTKLTLWLKPTYFHRVNIHPSDIIMYLENSLRKLVVKIYYTWVYFKAVMTIALHSCYYNHHNNSSSVHGWFPTATIYQPVTYQIFLDKLHELHNVILSKLEWRSKTIGITMLALYSTTSPTNISMQQPILRYILWKWIILTNCQILLRVITTLICDHDLSL